MIGDSTDHHQEWDVVHSYDRSEELPSEVVVRAVAGTTNQNACSIEPLYNAVEPEALDSFLDEGDQDSIWVSFFYDRCRVYVDDESVAVSLNEESATE